MASERGGPSGGSSSAMAMVLLEAAVDLRGETLSHVWRETWPAAPPLTGVAGSDGPAGALTFELAGLTGGIGMMPGTIPGGELDGPAATAWLWPDAPSDIGRVQAHAVVFVAGPGPAIEIHRALTRVVGAVLRATGGLGVYWGAATRVMRADIFLELAQDHEPDGVPVILWVDFRPFLDGGRPSLFTTGLAAFGLLEIEVASSSLPPDDLWQMASNIATYLIENGPVIKDGDTVGGDEHQRILARHAPSMVGRPGPVLRLEGS